MKQIKSLSAILIVFLLLSACKNTDQTQETLLNCTPHIEDSIIYNLPQVARLCDNMNVEKKHVDIGDCMLYCEIEGDGIPLVLIHGGPGGTHHCFHPWLSGAGKKFKVIYYDQRGCGLSDFNAGEGYSFEQTVDDLESLRKALKIDKWIVLGHSFGGGVAQFYTIKYPQHVSGLILVGSVPMINKPELNGANENCFLNEQEKQKTKEVLNLIIAGKLTYAQYFYNNDINGGWKRQNFVKPAKERQAQMATYDIVFDKTYNSDYESYDFEHAFDSCPIPTLICEGRYDSLWSNKKVPAMRKNHPNTRFRYFEKSSHNIYSDEPEVFLNVITGWADSLEVAKSEKIIGWQSYTDKVLAEQFNLITNNRLFIKMIKAEGIEKARLFYENFKKTNPGKCLFFERSMNSLAYQFLYDNNIETAIELFELNVREYPQSWNVYDSLGEAYLKKGDKQKAKTNYLKSLELNPGNANAKKMLTEI